jgi:C-terminal processing protease CtpA/Prc
MLHSRQLIPRALALCILSASAFAQEAPTLKEAVREHYVDEVEGKRLESLDGAVPFSTLDPYSHFMSEQELLDVSQSKSSETFLLRLDTGALYLRIPVFHAKTASQVSQQLASAMNGSGTQSIVIDLRGNRGGLLNAAVEVADEFIADGTLASTQGRQDNANLVFLAKPSGVAEQMAIAVLVDRHTASAAELLAGILRINAGARLLGQNTFGKSAVQTQIRLKDGASLSLTTASYFFSDGNTVSASGLRPDLPVSSWRMWRHPPPTISQIKRGEPYADPLLNDAAASAARR